MLDFDDFRIIKRCSLQNFENSCVAFFPPRNLLQHLFDVYNIGHSAIEFQHNERTNFLRMLEKYSTTPPDVSKINAPQNAQERSSRDKAFKFFLLTITQDLGYSE